VCDSEGCQAAVLPWGRTADLQERLDRRHGQIYEYMTLNRAPSIRSVDWHHWELLAVHEAWISGHGQSLENIDSHSR
jgi:hypothetical protein